MTYTLTVWHGSTATTTTIRGFKALSKAIDKAWKVPGFTRYEVGPA